MRPALLYISERSLRSGPSAREAEALRQARIAEVRALLAEIAAKPGVDGTASVVPSRSQVAVSDCRCGERLVA
jgi:hypothetical protein